MGLRPDDLYLYADLTQQCWTVNHLKWAFGLGVRFGQFTCFILVPLLSAFEIYLFFSRQIPMIVLYVFGIPIAAFIVLRNNRTELHNIDTRRKYSFLYAVRKNCVPMICAN